MSVVTNKTERHSINSKFRKCVVCLILIQSATKMKMYLFVLFTIKQSIITIVII